jgi:hypothetical protein
MCTLESSDAYMLLQCCAQMTFDSSRLVDTASIGYSHLQPAGLQVLRQRYRPAVLDNLRVSGWLAGWLSLALPGCLRWLCKVSSRPFCPPPPRCACC